MRNSYDPLTYLRNEESSEEENEMFYRNMQHNSLTMMNFTNVQVSSSVPFHTNVFASSSGSVVDNNGLKRKRGESDKKPRSLKWTHEMDRLLTEGTNLYQRDWVKIAAHVKHNLTNDQCRHRWSEVLDPDLAGLKRGQWTTEEEMMLTQYVKTHTGKKGNDKIIDWRDAPELLGRIGSDCQHKWTSMRQFGLRKGPFSAEEDSIIIARVREWGNKGPGLWVAIEKEIGRSSNNCNHRWKRYLKQKVAEEDTVTFGCINGYL